MPGRWQADVVLRGGAVFDGAGRVEALAIRDGRVAWSGPSAQAQDWVGPRTQVIELEGRLAVPGFHDAHTHLLGGSLAEEQLDLLAVRDDAALAAAVAARIVARGADVWVTGRGWDADLFPGQAWPSRAALDRVSPHTPVLVRRRDGHAALANARALALAGITRDTPDPPGGVILRDAGGEPTGILLEDPALELVTRLIPRADEASQARAVAKVAQRCAALGITSVQDDPSYADDLRPGPLYAGLWERGELPLRIEIWRRLGRPLDELAEEERALTATGAPRAQVAYGLLKGYLDGSLGSRTALLFEPYADAPGLGLGVPVTEPSVLTERVLEAHAAGYQVGLHAIGDRAAALALDVYAAVGERHGRESLRRARHRVEHGQMFRPADLSRLAALGVVASVQPIHLASDMRVAVQRLGAERCRTAYPWRGLVDAGAVVAFGTDYPVEPLDPLPGLRCAVARTSPREPDLPAFEPAQALTLPEALAAYGVGGAQACHREHELGSLRPGYLADVAVLSGDPFQLPPDAWGELRCELTLLGGQVVFAR